MAESAKVSTSVGKSFEVALESMGAAGYEWTPQFEARLLRLKRTDYRPVDSAAEAKGQAVGGARVVVFVFEALAPGETKIRLANKREWEASAVEERTVAVTVR